MALDCKFIENLFPFIAFSLFSDIKIVRSAIALLTKYGLNSIQELLYIDLLTVYNVDTRLGNLYNATA